VARLLVQLVPLLLVQLAPLLLLLQLLLLPLLPLAQLGRLEVGWLPWLASQHEWCYSGECFTTPRLPPCRVLGERQEVVRGVLGWLWPLGRSTQPVQ